MCCNKEHGQSFFDYIEKQNFFFINKNKQGVRASACASVCAAVFDTCESSCVQHVCCENALCWWQRDEVDPMSVFEAEEQQLLLQRQQGSFGSCGLHDTVFRWISEL